jgi:hypothetical protein
MHYRDKPRDTARGANIRRETGETIQSELTVAHLVEEPPRASDRERLLVHRRRALAALSHPNLPQDLRESYQMAADSASAALGPDDAIRRRQAG